MERIPDDVLERIEREHARGITSVQILEVLAEHQVKFSEATLRKYVQLGLLPRSVRVGRKVPGSRGKHQGSQGLYPATVVRQIRAIRDMMAADYTIEEIQRQFLFVRGDIEELERVFERVLQAFRDASKDHASETASRAVATDLESAEALGKELISKLNVIEQRLTAQFRHGPAVASSQSAAAGDRKLSKKLAG